MNTTPAQSINQQVNAPNVSVSVRNAAARRKLEWYREERRLANLLRDVFDDDDTARQKAQTAVQ